MNNRENDDNKGNKHIKVSIRYIGNPNAFRQNYVGNTVIGTIKNEAILKFNIHTEPQSYCLQFGDQIVNEIFTLEEAGFQTGEKRYDLDLIIKDMQDTDGE